MRLFWVRHGLAQDREDPACPPDADRPLTEVGIRKTWRAMCGLATLLPERPVFWTSPYLRARQTAALVRRACRDRLSAGARSRGQRDWVETELLLPDGCPRTLLRHIGSQSAAALVLVGHCPQLDAALALLCGHPSPRSELHFKKAGAACVDVSAQAIVAEQLHWFLPPSVLRALAQGAGAPPQPPCQISEMLP